jgi:protein gp37
MMADGIRFSEYSDALDYFTKIVDDSRRPLKKLQQEQAKKQRAIENARREAARLREHVSLEEWNKLDQQTKAALLPPDPSLVAASQFDKEDRTALEWAMWSWNPITGCEHNCTYCYAREIATSGKMAKVYPYAFAPALRPYSLLTPRNMKVPPEAERDERYRNVFVGSMADMFGPWVPAKWVEVILSEIRNAPVWNFLCLTKFPKRMAEFEIPPNMWMGATVDLQARVAVTEEAFTNLPSKIKWLACEPLLQRLQFQHLDRFDWMVIGGARANKQGGTPEWRPPFPWIADLWKQAEDAGVKVDFTKDLLGNRVREWPFHAPIELDPTEAPAIFHYLTPP